MFSRPSFTVLRRYFQSKTVLFSNLDIAYCSLQQLTERKQESGKQYGQKYYQHNMERMRRIHNEYRQRNKCSIDRYRSSQRRDKEQNSRKKAERDHQRISESNKRYYRNNVHKIGLYQRNLKILGFKQKYKQDYNKKRQTWLSKREEILSFRPEIVCPLKEQLEKILGISNYGDWYKLSTLQLKKNKILPRIFAYINLYEFLKVIAIPNC
eukprot:TRINITY_DN7238_c0_g1_i1.p1 TRINITY_DN7238_c0_g1~~TRINITY_DN7238_c0_g1_i1.p1  ORF type:complete len:210 (-),score=27.79 TRINITY_DN7238_c0_g1_i1:777-1406(-)